MTRFCNELILEILSYSFYILGDQNRLQIVCLLWKQGNLCVCEIVEKLDLKQNLVSHHLWKLKEAWLVKSKRNWKKNCYEVDREFYNKFKDQLQHVFNL